jgi:hypothetical protein
MIFIRLKLVAIFSKIRCTYQTFGVDGVFYETQNHRSCVVGLAN